MEEKKSTSPEWNPFRWLFIIAAIWNFAGAFPGLLDSSGMFAREFGRALNDPVLIAVYRGAWGTAFLYGLGFLLVAYNPIRHSGIVLMGGDRKGIVCPEPLVHDAKWMDIALCHTGGHR